LNEHAYKLQKGASAGYLTNQKDSPMSFNGIGLFLSAISLISLSMFHPGQRFPPSPRGRRDRNSKLA
jgi:hypothetical protein